MNEDRFLDAVVDRLREVRGVRAVVLGGSRARETHSPDSDYDLGLYYDSAAPPDLAALDLIAADLDDSRRRGIITPLGGWGPWINGGGWLLIEGRHVDFLYRDLGKVGSTIDACRAGHVEIAYQPGHPHGFVTTIYMGEIDACRPLWESDGCVSALKALTRPYPVTLGRR